MKQLFTLSISVSLLTLINLSACAKNDLDLEKNHDDHKIITSLVDATKYRQNIEDLMLAEIHFQLSHYGQADQYYSKLLTSYNDTDLIRHAIKVAFKRHDFEKALKLALLWHKASPNSMSAVSTVIGLYQQFEQYDDVVTLLKKYSVSEDTIDLDTVIFLLEQHPPEESYQSLVLYTQKFIENNDQAVMQLALFALRAKRFKEAINASERLSAVASKDIVHKMAIIKVQAYTKLHKPELALKELQRLIKEAMDVHTKHKYARIMATLGKIDDSIALLTEEFKNSPQNTSYLHDIISIYLTNKQYVKALPVVDQLLKFEQEKDNAYFYQGLIYQGLNDNKQSLQSFLQISAQGLTNETRNIIVDLIYQIQGIDVALDYIHKAQKSLINPIQVSELYVLESDMLRKVREFDLALEVIEKADALFPDNLNVYYSQALLFEDVGSIDKSEQSLLKILALDSTHYSALNALGYLLSVHTSRFDEAYDYIKKAHDLQPQNPAIIDSLGWVSYQQGNLERAERYLRLAFEKMPDPEVASHLVKVLSKQGNQEEALTVLDEMIKKYPNNKLLIQAKVDLEAS